MQVGLAHDGPMAGRKTLNDAAAAVGDRRLAAT